MRNKTLGSFYYKAIRYFYIGTGVYYKATCV